MIKIKIEYIPINNKTMGKKLKVLRGNIPIREVSKCTGIAISTIAMYENGYRRPKDENKIKLSEFYNISIEDIFFVKEVTKCDFEETHFGIVH